MKKSEWLRMSKSRIILALLVMFAIGLTNIGFCQENAAAQAGKCTCFKMIYTTADGKNMTIDFYMPSCDGMCGTNNTQMLYMNSKGECKLNGQKSPFCQCGPNCPVGCTCLANLTLDSIVTTLEGMM